MISIIVPIREEDPAAAACFAPFVDAPETELLVADGTGGSPAADAFARIGARVLKGSGTRGARLALAAREARGDVLFFLHADSVAPDAAPGLIREALDAGAVAGAFSLAYTGGGAGMRWVAWWANLRSRFLRLPFGDQGIFCRRDVYERVGGFRDLPICDDVDLVRRLRRAGAFRLLPEKTRTSPRRYAAHGVARQVLRNWRVLAGYFAGVSPATLSRWYNEEVKDAPPASARAPLERKAIPRR
ncbi:MAG: TIGR04283 family arsenosugar biosynthesis glycosyltransferase [Thermoanaerobaculia bacterium]